MSEFTTKEGRFGDQSHSIEMYAKFINGMEFQYLNHLIETKSNKKKLKYLSGFWGFPRPLGRPIDQAVPGVFAGTDTFQALST